MNLAPFECTKCGACCRNVELSEETRHLSRGDGVCRDFDDRTSTCRIYDSRPDICRVDTQYALRYRGQMSWEDFCALNAACCESLRVMLPSSA